MNYIKPIGVKDVSSLITELKKLKFVKVAYVEELDEYLVEVPMRSKFWIASAKLFRMPPTTYVLQILKHKKTKKHWIFFDDLMKLNSFKELEKLIQVLKKEVSGNSSQT